MKNKYIFGFMFGLGFWTAKNLIEFANNFFRILILGY